VQLDLLWNFMQADMEADNFENEMRQAPNRQKLIKNRNILLEQQGSMKKLEDDISAMSDRMEAIADERTRLEAVVAEQQKAFAEDPPTDLQAISGAISSIAKSIDALARFEQELFKLRKDADTRDRQQKEIRVRAAKAKAEYDQTKTVYDEELKRDSGKLKDLRVRAEKEGGAVAPKLLEKYKSIKQFTVPPMAQLINDQCSGCYMSLPSVTLIKVKSEEDVVCCDNCGRILFVKQ
jgi:predicted  nucleic acid-binding Zn-ribbon protein